MMKLVKKPTSFLKIKFSKTSNLMLSRLCHTQGVFLFIQVELSITFKLSIWAFERALRCNLFCHPSTAFRDDKKGFSLRSLTQNLQIGYSTSFNAIHRIALYLKPSSKTYFDAFIVHCKTSILRYNTVG
ncbi:MAG: hypothetical protein JWQ25_2652 [Daejeonella sp.]|nr:hypothetical protein [Daejeonella sp.]